MGKKSLCKKSCPTEVLEPEYFGDHHQEGGVEAGWLEDRSGRPPEEGSGERVEVFRLGVVLRCGVVRGHRRVVGDGHPSGDVVRGPDPDPDGVRGRHRDAEGGRGRGLRLEEDLRAGSEDIRHLHHHPIHLMIRGVN